YQADASPGELQDEPTPRPTPTPAPFIELIPSEGISPARVQVTVNGALWIHGVQVQLFWDGLPERVAIADVALDGTFQTRFETPTTEPGPHIVTAIQELPGGIRRAEATFLFLEPTPTWTPTVTDTPPPSLTPSDTPIPPTQPPTSTPLPTTTPTPSPTLRPVTPMVTITPIPPTPGLPRPPAATRTNTPRPGTPTNTLTPSVTPTPSNTPGPGTPSATPEPSPTPVDQIVDTGGGWGSLFLWGFVLAGLVVVFRLLRVRSLAG
ncbi:MAG: hypothetical protein JXA14_17105, partial [Anaerolineae bacterium]|nr:hypothetical protein [Anaerolineae bacterium]